jgi:hypothetical protein
VAVRAALIDSRTKYISLARALLRQEGYRVRSGSAATFPARVREQALPDAVRARLEPLLVAMAGLNDQLAADDFLLKPIDAQTIRGVVVQHCGDPSG